MAKTKYESFEESLKKGDLDGVRNNFEKDFLENIIDEDSKSSLRPIHWACRHGHVTIVKFLIDQKCNIEGEDKNKRRPIHFACQNGSVEMVKLLIDRKCNIESEQKEKWRPIHFACHFGSVEMVKLLIDKKCNIESEDIENWRPVHIACQHGSIEMVKLLIGQKCKIESEQKEQWRPIHIACWIGSVEMVKLLIDQKCNVESENKNKWRPIHFACRYGSAEMVKLLLHQKCNIESEQKEKWRPIHIACHYGLVEIVKLLIAHSCKIEVKNRNGQTPLEMARSKGHNEIVKWIEGFLKKNSELCHSITNNDLEAFIKHWTGHISMILDITSKTPWLEMALKNKEDKFIKFFIGQPIHPLDIVTIRNIVGEDITQSLNYQLWEEVFLFKCIRDQNLKGFLLLCRPNVINRQRKMSSCSFLEVAAEHGNCLFVNEILKKSIFDSESWKGAKVIALKKGHNEIAESISMRKSLLECRQKADLSILHTAVHDNDSEMVEYILKDENLSGPNHNHEINSDMINIALINKQTNILKSLFTHSSLNVMESMIEKVLYHFADFDDEESFQWLLEMEIKSPGYLENGETLLTGLIKEKRKNFYRKIIQSKKNIKKYIDLKNKKRQTPLQVSIETESMEIMQHFSFETVDFDNEDIEGRTALMQLFEKLSNNVDENRSIGFMNVIRTIIDKGGNIYLKTQKGINIIECCSQPSIRQEVENYFLTWKQKKVTVEKEVKPKITCEICMDREVDSVFDCGHTICKNCSDKIVRCPFCGFEPARPKRIYLG